MFRIFMLFILVLLLVYYFHKMKRLNISDLFGMFWTIQLTFCMMFLPDVDWCYSGCIWILVVVATFSVGFHGKTSLSEKYYRSNNRAHVQTIDINIERTRILLLSIFGIAFLYMIRLVVKYGFTLQNFINLSSLLNMSSTISEQRYQGVGEGKSILDTLLLVFVYLGPMLGGYSYNFMKQRKDKILCVVMLLPELMILLSENTKAGMIACVIFWGVAFFVGHIKKNGRIIYLSKKVLFGIVILLLACVLLLYFSMLLRLGEISEWSINVVTKKFANYLFGHIVAFDLWFDNNMFIGEYSFGGMTFLGISRYLGMERVTGVFQEVIKSGGISTNVYSYFRTVIMDFGVIGGVLMFSLLGYLTKYLFDRITICKKNTYISETILIAILAYIVFFMTSIFSYTSYICAFILLPFSLKFIQQKKYV